jgi:hypothetical protein
MYTDAYEFKRSQHNQAIDNNFNTYSRKDTNYLPDINQGVYGNGGLTLVQFDLSSIYNSSRFTDPSDLVLVMPLTIVAAYTTGTAGAAIAPLPGSCNLISLKSGYVNLIHQADVVVNGKTLNQLQPYTGFLKNFEMLSQMSSDDLAVWGSSYGLGENLDNPRSVTLSTPNAGVGLSPMGVGLCNNVPFGNIAPVGTAPALASEYSLQTPQTQNGNTANSAILSRLNTITDTTIPTVGQKIYGTNAGLTIMDVTRLSQEFKPYYVVLNNYMVWYDFAIIRIGDLLESMKSIPLTRRFDAVIRLYVNTGAFSVPVTGALAPALVYGQPTLALSTFTNTCPIMLNWLPNTTGNFIVPGATTTITAGCFIGRPPTTSLNNTNLATSGASNPLNSCRMYYSSIELADARQTLQYVESNRAKKVVYRNFVANFISAVASGSSYSALMQSGLTNPVAVIIQPWISNSQSPAIFLGPGAPPQWGSPYDSGTGSPVSLTNLQVTVGGVNQLNTTLQYTYENFLQNVSLVNQISGSDFGVSVGLFDRKYWEMNRPYVVLVRSKPADMESPRNINISFTNNSNCTIDLFVYCVYLDSCIIDVDNGRITK